RRMDRVYANAPPGARPAGRIWSDPIESPCRATGAISRSVVREDLRKISRASAAPLRGAGHLDPDDSDSSVDLRADAGFTRAFGREERHADHAEEELELGLGGSVEALEVSDVRRDRRDRQVRDRRTS